MKNVASSLRHTGVSAIFLVFSAVFCVCLVCSNFFVARLWSIGFLDLEMSGAVIIFPVSYIINDLLTEVYGYKATRFVLWMGFLLCLFISLMTLLITSLPAPIYDESRDMAEKFDSVYAVVPRSMAGSLLAFIAGSLTNSLVMSKMKVASSGKKFWLRAIVSSVAGEVLDSLVFFPIAYAGVIPAAEILKLAATECPVKVLFEIIILPLTYVAVRRVKRVENLDTFDRNISYNPFKITEL